ncbi:MAG: helix-turn-helix transcriptional regulator [Gammaproteobacteria bacterium]|nr:MAG: helix-turn-helix transcriptional regulator [Gammaproteobacteria bacterium]
MNIQNTQAKDSFSIPRSQEKIDCNRLEYLYINHMNDIAINIPDFIKAVRAKLGLTQLQLADLMNCTKGNINSWEKGRHEPSYSQLVKLSRKSGIPLPHDQDNQLALMLGVNLDELDMDQVEIIKSTTKIPKGNRLQARKIIGTFTEDDLEKELNK